MKTLTKKTYNLPSDVMAEFEKRVPAGKRGAAMGEAVARWLEEKRLEEIRARIDESFEDEENMKLYAQIEREWAPLSDEVWSQIDDDWSKMSAEEMDKEFSHGR